ncbi:MAG: GNAT family N-acetyltransferase [Candidatus Moraniibacteriota bacterium]
MSVKLKTCLCGKCTKNLLAVKFCTFGKPNKKSAKKIIQLVRFLRNKHGAKMLPRTVDFYLSHETIVVKNFFGKVIGIISIVAWDDSNIEIVSHAIHPSYQGQGLGALLFDKMKKKLRLFNPGAIFCFTNQVEFYGKLGFVKTDPAQFGKKIQDNCNGCPNGPNGPGFDPCPEFAMRYTGNPWKKKGEMHC